MDVRHFAGNAVNVVSLFVKRELAVANIVLSKGPFPTLAFLASWGTVKIGAFNGTVGLRPVGGERTAAIAADRNFFSFGHAG